MEDKKKKKAKLQRGSHLGVDCCSLEESLSPELLQWYQGQEEEQDTPDPLSLLYELLFENGIKSYVKTNTINQQPQWSFLYLV